MYRDSGYSQSSASPRASSECPHPGGGMSLDVTENPCRDSRGEEHRVNKSFGDEVKTLPYLRDGDVTAASCLPAVALAFRGGSGLSHGGRWWYRFKRYSVPSVSSMWSSCHPCAHRVTIVFIVLSRRGGGAQACSGRMQWRVVGMG